MFRTAILDLFQDGRHRYNFEKVSIAFPDLQNICLDIKIMFYDIYKQTYQYINIVNLPISETYFKGGTQLFY